MDFLSNIILPIITDHNGLLYKPRERPPPLPQTKNGGSGLPQKRRVIEEIKEAVQKIKYYKKKYPIIHAYFGVGIPDITHGEKGGGYEEVTIADDTNDLVDTIKPKFLKLADVIKDTGSRVCICTLPPMDLEKWNLHRQEKKRTKNLLHKRYYPIMHGNLNYCNQ